MCQESSFYCKWHQGCVLVLTLFLIMLSEKATEEKHDRVVYICTCKNSNFSTWNTTKTTMHLVRAPACRWHGSSYVLRCGAPANNILFCKDHKMIENGTGLQIAYICHILLHWTGQTENWLWQTKLLVNCKNNLRKVQKMFTKPFCCLHFYMGLYPGSYTSTILVYPGTIIKTEVNSSLTLSFWNQSWPQASCIKARKQ